MFLSSSGLAFCLVSLFVLVSSDRTLDPQINPGCGMFRPNCQQIDPTRPFMQTLLFVQSEDAQTNDTLDYLMYWSLIGAPTFFLDQVPHGTKSLSGGISWPEFIEDGHVETAFFVPPAGRYVGITLKNLIEFEDYKNTGRLEDATNITVHNFTNAKWYNVSIANSKDGVVATFQGTFGSKPEDRNITIEMRAYTTTTRETVPPRLQTPPGAMTMRVILDKAYVHWERSRFAFEIIHVSNDASNAPAVHSVDESISDEFTPGVFTAERIAGKDTYMQWRPVVYTAANPGVSDSTRSRTGPLNYNITIERNTSTGAVPYSLLIGLDGTGYQLTHFNLSLGQTDDDYYNSTAFQEWTCQLGIGTPMADPISSKVKLAIAIGFGLPAALIIIGSSYVAYKKIQRRRQERSLLVSETTTTNYETLVT